MATKTGHLSMTELTEMLKAVQEKEKAQDQLVRRFQKLVCEEGVSAIANFPYPMAVYQQDGTLTYVNCALSLGTGLFTSDLPSGSHNILNRITDANFPLLDAVEQVFMEKTTFLWGLSDPLDIFISENTSGITASSQYQSAILFPMTMQAGKVSQGAVIFMKGIHKKLKQEGKK